MGSRELCNRSKLAMPLAGGWKKGHTDLTPGLAVTDSVQKAHQTTRILDRLLEPHNGLVIALSLVILALAIFLVSLLCV